MKGKRLNVSVLIPQLSYEDDVCGWAADDTLLIVDAPGPLARKPLFERLRLAGPCEGFAHDLMSPGH